MKAKDTFIESDGIYMAGETKMDDYGNPVGFVHLYFDPNIWIPGTKPWSENEFDITDDHMYNDTHTPNQRLNAYRSMIKIGRNTPDNLEDYKKTYESWFGHYPGECHPPNQTENVPDPSIYKDYLPFRKQCYTPYAGDYHDAVLLTAEAIKLCLDDWEEICENLINSNKTEPDKCAEAKHVLPECLKGTTFVAYTKNITNFTGVHGTYSFDKIADSSASYGFYDLNMDSGAFEKIGYYDSYMEVWGEVNSFVQVSDSLDWPGEETPVNRPYCGFTGDDEKCQGRIINSKLKK